MEDVPMFMVYERNVAGIIIFVISSIGLLCNSIVAVYTHTLPSMENAFGKLTQSQAIAEGILCFCFTFYFSPMMIFGFDSWVPYSKHSGWIQLICYDICCISHLFIAINRLSAICFPLSYDRLFSTKNTKIMIAVSWIVPIITAIFLYKVWPCDFFFSDMFWAYIFPTTPACNFISWNIDFHKDIFFVVLIAVFDIVTIFTVRSTSKKISANDLQLIRRRKREINFLKQAVLQGIVFVIELLTYFYFAWKFQNKWVIFCLTTVAWNLVHMTDAMIIIMFNSEFRKLIKAPFERILRSTTGSSAQSLRGGETRHVVPEISANARKGE